MRRAPVVASIFVSLIAIGCSSAKPSSGSPYGNAHPFLHISPSVGRAGATVAITGGGTRPSVCDEVEVWVQRPGTGSLATGRGLISKKRVPVKADGTFAGSVKIPANARAEPLTITPSCVLYGKLTGSMGPGETFTVVP